MVNIIFLTSLDLSQLLDKSHGLSLQASLHSPSGTSAHNSKELIVAQVQKLLQLKSLVGELSELSLLAERSNSL